MQERNLTKDEIKSVESSLAVLRWTDIVAIDKTVAKGDRAETVPIKGGVKVLRVRREEAK